MRKLVVTQNITVDGVVDAAGDWFSPAGDGTDTSDLEAMLRDQMNRQDALILGRKTFEEFRGYWPKQTNDKTGVSAHLNQVAKYVVSNTLDDPQWENTTVLGGDFLEEVRTLKQQSGGEIGVTGSITVVYQLIDAGLVDEYRLYVYPVVIGTGRRLFRENSSRLDLKLLEAMQFRSGVSLLRYEMNG